MVCSSHTRLFFNCSLTIVSFLHFINNNLKFSQSISGSITFRSTAFFRACIHASVKSSTLIFTDLVGNNRCLFRVTYDRTSIFGLRGGDLSLRPLNILWNTVSLCPIGLERRSMVRQVYQLAIVILLIVKLAAFGRVRSGDRRL